MVLEEQNGIEQWDVPAGGIDSGELPSEACLREITEETGLVVAESNLQFVGVVSAKNKDHTVFNFIFTTEASNGAAEALNPQDSDIKDVGFFSKQEVVAILESGDYEHKIAKARLELFVSSDFRKEGISIEIKN